VIERLSALPEGARAEADLCIIGGGAAGIALALKLRGSGLSVLLAESGGEAGDESALDLNRVTQAGHPFPGAVEGRARRLGGATTLWAGQSLPLDPVDFERRDWVPHSGWPIRFTEVARHYAEAERLLRLEGLRYDEAAWNHLGEVPPPFDEALLRPQVSWLAKHRDFGAMYRAALAADPDTRVLLEATATRIRPPSGEDARYAVELASLSGRRAELRARRVVICCGGLDTPRLLLASGLGKDLVGRFLQDHPTATVGEVEAPDFDRLAAWFRPFYRKEGRLFPKIALAEAAQRAERVLNVTSELVFTAPDESPFASARAFYGAFRGGETKAALGRAARLAMGGGEMLGYAWTRLAKRRLPAAKGARITLWAHIEQAPDPESRVTLDPVERDALGMPRARLDWRLGELDRRSFEVFAEVVGREFARLGVGRLVPAPWLREAGWRAEVQDFYHHIGTARMGSSPAEGVVDPHLEVFGAPGLYVASSAVFPTGGASNPTLTILALTLRLAERLRGR
jgi:choline dehydrogenase-like flavoprotein